mgnify:CR=1 FL=1
MVSAGMSLHFVGEIAQLYAAVVGGDDFGISNNVREFFLDPHNIPFWTFNVPAIYLLGKSGIYGLYGLGSNIIKVGKEIKSIINKAKSGEGNEIGSN